MNRREAQARKVYARIMRSTSPATDYAVRVRARMRRRGCSAEEAASRVRAVLPADSWFTRLTVAPAYPGWWHLRRYWVVEVSGQTAGGKPMARLMQALTLVSGL